MQKTLCFAAAKTAMIIVPRQNSAYFADVSRLTAVFYVFYKAQKQDYLYYMSNCLENPKGNKKMHFFS